MLTDIQNRQLNQLLALVDQLTADSIFDWHQTLAEDIHLATHQIQQLTVAANQAALVEEMVKLFEKNQDATLKALELPLKALGKLAESGHLSDAQKAKLFMELGRTYELLTQWDMALDRFHRVLDYSQDDLSTQAFVHNRIGRIKSRQRDYLDAERHYRASIEIFSEQNNSYQIAQITINIGFNDFKQNNYDKAEANYLTALETARATERAQRLVADAEMNLAILETVRGDFENAQSHYQQCIASYTAIDDTRGMAQAYYNMAMLCVDMQAWEKAGECYHFSLESAQKWGDMHLIGHIYLSWTELALKLGDYTLAQACSMHAIKTFSRLGSQSPLAEAYKFASQIQHRRQNFAKADRFFQKSIELAQACDSRLNLAEAHYAYGLCLLDKPDKAAAKIQFDKALQLFTELGASADMQNTQAALKRLEEPGNEANNKPRFKRIQR